MLTLGLVGASFTACSDDDDPAVENNGGGAWEGELGDAEVLVGVWGNPGVETMQFSADGVLTFSSYGSGYSASYEYDQTTGMLICSDFSDSANYVEKWEVRRLTKNVLYIVRVWSGFNDGTVDDAAAYPCVYPRLTDDGKELSVDDSNSAAALVGTWRDVCSSYQTTFTFNSDGSAVYYENDPEEGEYYDSGFYTYDPATHFLTITADGESESARILVNDDLLIVFYGSYIEEIYLRQ